MKDDRITIYVELLDEGTPCWRPVLAEPLTENTYQIVDSIPEDEVWMFQPGDIVRCEQREFSGGVGLAAYESATAS
jgi:hypothetical protein